MPCEVLDFQQIDRTQRALVGGKGAHLGELSRIDGVRVPPGVCVTTDAFARVVGSDAAVRERLDRLARSLEGDRDAVRALSAEVREAIEAIEMPADLADAITHAVERLGSHSAYAVRSSATAEDMPNASFAGQQDTYLNVVGAREVIRHVVRCWASLFTERAVIYRLQNGIDHRTVQMAVVVQRMVFPQAAGVLFTADPVTGNRNVSSIDASFGLGEALVSGVANPDVFKVRGGEIVSRSIASKPRAIVASPNGGTEDRDVEPDRVAQPALSDTEVVRLAELGRRIEAHFGQPQDIEWCLADDEFQIVQSRPITTLFPIPDATDRERRVYISVGHQQMMTDAMKPLGLSLWQRCTARPMAEAGGRLFVDVTQGLASPASRGDFLEVLGKSDPFMRDALRTLLDRADFLRPLPDVPAPPHPLGGPPAPIDADPAIVTRLIERTQASIATLKREIRAKSGPDLVDFILDDTNELRRILFDPESHRVIMAGFQATWWLNDHLQTWLGEKNAADVLAQSVPNNVTSEMGLALLDVADAIRPHPEVVAFLQQVDDDDFLTELPRLAGGREARDAIQGWLDRYGMRGAGEIDVTRPRWSERPTTLLSIILTNVRTFEPGEAGRRFARGLDEARAKEHDILERLRALPDGEQKAAETKGMIDRLRTFVGFREYPKYGKVSRTFVYKQALLDEAGRLVAAGVLREREDLFYLRLEELQEVVRTSRADYRLIDERKAAFASYQSLRPPRVLTSEGEGISGEYRPDDLPASALVGLPASAGTVEGRARVIVDMADADLEPGDILVTPFTDPSWTPLFVAIAGLVTDVGGPMTHGAVIAREYGIPAVVGVANATRTIRDGQRIRVHGTEGYVEILS